MTVDALLAAGERYRERVEIDTKWDEAIAEFADGNYKAALRQFYRLPVRSEADDVERFKVNGWYNLGVGALQAGSCDIARSHFQDARSIHGDDADAAVLAGLELAKNCDIGSKTYRRNVDALQIRALTD